MIRCKGWKVLDNNNSVNEGHRRLNYHVVTPLPLILSNLTEVAAVVRRGSVSSTVNMSAWAAGQFEILVRAATVQKKVDAVWILIS